MNIKMLRESGQIIFECVTGSHAYGTATPKSDKDIRGIFVRPLKDRFSFKHLPDEVGQEKPEDFKFYEVAKFFDLAKGCNPNIVEYMFMPEDCVVFCDPRMSRII